MKRNNRRWGARRIKGELRKIGITLSKSSIRNILNDAGYPPSARNFEETKDDPVAASVRRWKTYHPQALVSSWYNVDLKLLRMRLELGRQKNPQRFGWGALSA